MNKILLCFSVVALLAVSSCKKGCARCYAYDEVVKTNGEKSAGNQIYQSKDVCGSNFDMKNYKSRFENNFSAYYPKCIDIN